MWYIGIDLHSRTFTAVVLNESGEERFSQCLATSSRNLIETVDALKGKKQVVLEESTLAGWAYRTLCPVASVVVADPWHNRSIGKDEKLDDERAARKLARLLRMGEIQPVHHTPDPAHQDLKELVTIYHGSSGEVSRARCRLKAKFAQHGVLATDRTLYATDARRRWLEALPSGTTRYLVERLYADLDHALEKRALLRGELAKRARAIELIGRLRTVPGIGLIRAATFYAIIDTLERFADRRKLWSYCGIGLVQRRSGESGGPVHLTRRGNPLLKNVAKGAAVTAIAAGDNLFAEQYQSLLKGGLRPELARLTVARAIISTLYALWRDGTSYDPERRKGDCDRQLPTQPAVRG